MTEASLSQEIAFLRRENESLRRRLSSLGNISASEYLHRKAVVRAIARLDGRGIVNRLLTVYPR